MIHIHYSLSSICRYLQFLNTSNP